MRRYGLIGYPLTHSFSQKYFTEKFSALGITDCVYENYSLKEIGELTNILQTNTDICGLNITIPHKRNVLSFITEATELVTEIGACNCIHFKNGKRIGYNTDVFGFTESLRPFLKDFHRGALILGTGGASSAVAYALKTLGIANQYVSRNASPTSISYSKLTESVLANHSLIINTTPLGMFPKIEECPPIPYHLLGPQHHLFDLVYNPSETTFLRIGKAQGASIQNGAEMLVLQAEESWRIWND